jgi:acid phosphatase
MIKKSNSFLQPNYITMIASSIAAGVYDDADHNSTQNTLVDILEPAGLIFL